MVQLKRSEIRLIEQAVAWPNGFGYVLDFSDRTMAEFFEDEFGIEIYQDQYSHNGSSKRNYLKSFVEVEDAFIVVKVLRALWERREALVRRHGGELDAADEAETREAFLKLIADIETGSEVLDTSALDRFAQDRTLEELIADINRDLQANKPEAAMDHLHTYCMRKFAHLLKVRGVECADDEPLHSRFGRYRKLLEQEQNLTDFTNRALKSGISLLEGFNSVRNDRSFAHPNPILDNVEARYVFESVSSLLSFVRSVEARRYEE